MGKSPTVMIAGSATETGETQARPAYDRIVIGGRRELKGSAGVSADGSHGTVRPHWRRGHFRRIRFGEGLAESRLGWIRPVLVNAAEAFGPVPVKRYEVR